MNQIVHAKIQKWGNGLALRVAGVMRDIPKFQLNTPVNVEVFKDGFTVKIARPQRKVWQLPYTEAELLNGLTVKKAHADELAILQTEETGD